MPLPLDSIRPRDINAVVLKEKYGAGADSLGDRHPKKADAIMVAWLIR
jgi:hypothetical protein